MAQTFTTSISDCLKSKYSVSRWSYSFLYTLGQRTEPDVFLCSAKPPSLLPHKEATSPDFPIFWFWLTFYLPLEYCLFTFPFTEILPTLRILVQTCFLFLSSPPTPPLISLFPPQIRRSYSVPDIFLALWSMPVN